MALKTSAEGKPDRSPVEKATCGFKEGGPPRRAPLRCGLKRRGNPRTRWRVISDAAPPSRITRKSLACEPFSSMEPAFDWLKDRLSHLRLTTSQISSPCTAPLRSPSPERSTLFAGYLYKANKSLTRFVEDSWLRCAR